jgi:hypothetical protein
MTTAQRIRRVIVVARRLRRERRWKVNLEAEQAHLPAPSEARQAGLGRLAASMPPGKYTVTLLEFVKRECANWRRGTCLFGACSVAAGECCRVSRAVLTGGDPRSPDLPAPRLRQAGLPAPSEAR